MLNVFPLLLTFIEAIKPSDLVKHSTKKPDWVFIQDLGKLSA
jgi:hypothetical protein